MAGPLEPARDYYQRRAAEERELADQALDEGHREAHLTIAKRYEVYAELDLSPPLQAVEG